MVNLGLITQFNTYKLTTNSGKHNEQVSHVDIVCLLYKLLTSARKTDDLSMCFDRYLNRRKRELTSSKKMIGKYHVRIMLKDKFGFAQHQDKATHGLGYNVIPTRKSDNGVLNKGNVINNAKTKVISIHWYVPHYTPSLAQQNVLMNQITKQMAKELQFSERSVFMKQVNTQTLWDFELGSQEGVNVFIWIFVIFQRSHRQHDQNLNNDTFYRMPVTSAQCIIGSVKYPDSDNFLNYDDDYYFQGYSEVKEDFRLPTKVDIFQPYKG